MDINHIKDLKKFLSLEVLFLKVIQKLESVVGKIIKPQNATKEYIEKVQVVLKNYGDDLITTLKKETFISMNIISFIITGLLLYLIGQPIIVMIYPLLLLFLIILYSFYKYKDLHVPSVIIQGYITYSSLIYYILSYIASLFVIGLISSFIQNTIYLAGVSILITLFIIYAFLTNINVENIYKKLKEEITLQYSLSVRKINYGPYIIKGFVIFIYLYIIFTLYSFLNTVKYRLFVQKGAEVVYVINDYIISTTLLIVFLFFLYKTVVLSNFKDKLEEFLEELSFTRDMINYLKQNLSQPSIAKIPLVLIKEYTKSKVLANYESAKKFYFEVLPVFERGDLINLNRKIYSNFFKQTAEIMSKFLYNIYGKDKEQVYQVARDIFPSADTFFKLQNVIKLRLQESFGKLLIMFFIAVLVLFPMILNFVPLLLQMIVQNSKGVSLGVIQNFVKNISLEKLKKLDLWVPLTLVFYVFALYSIQFHIKIKSIKNYLYMVLKMSAVVIVVYVVVTVIARYFMVKTF
jgi:hypothetical protein